MIRRTLSLLAITSMVLLTSVSRADEPVKLRFKMQKDDRLIYQMTTKTEKTEKVMDRKIKTEITSKTIGVRTFKKIDDKGNIHLETQGKRINLTAKIGPLGEYKYDSTSTDNEKGSMLGGMFTPVLDTLNGASFNVTITPLGKVLPVKGYKELLADVIKDNPLKAQYSNEAFAIEFGESLVRLPEKAVKKGDTWEHKFEQKVPGVGTIKGTHTYTHAGAGKVGSTATVKITAVFEGTVEVETKANGAKITGTLTLSDSTATIHFDPKAGRVVSKVKKSSNSGTLDIDVNGMSIPVENEQTSELKIQLLSKLPN